MMKKEHDLDSTKSRKNPYAKHLKKQITIRVGVDVISYFKAVCDETGIPYQNLINLHLQERVEKREKPSLEWVS